MMEWFKIVGLHALGFMLTMFSMLGIPGNLMLNSKLLKLLSNWFTIFLNAGWVGIPILLIASLILKWMAFSEWAYVLGCISLVSGLGCFFTLLLIYRVKDKGDNSN
jgi:hypothetical protein